MQKSLTLIVLIGLLSACSPAPHDAEYADMASSPMAEVAGDSTEPTLQSHITDQHEQAHLADRQFIINANADFSVQDVVKSMETLETLTLRMGGYVQKSHVYNQTTDTQSYPIGNEQLKVLTQFVRHGQMIVRIPKANVGEFLKGVQGQVVFLESQSFSTTDVALDLQREKLHAQIETQKQAKLAELSATNTDDLADKSAHVDDIISSKYRQALAELDRQALAEQVAFSTIELNFHQNPEIFESVMPNTHAHITKDQRHNFGHQFRQNLGHGWQYFLQFILWLANLWAFVAGVVVLVVFYKKVFKPLWHKPLWHTTKPVAKPTSTDDKDDNPTTPPTIDS